MRIRLGRDIVRAALTCAVLLALAGLLLADDPPQYSPWSQAVIVGPPISTTLSGEGCPFIAKNNLDLYFRSNRPGGKGNYDIYGSHRETVEDDWEDPINLGPEINTSANELCSFVTIDGHWLYFVSNRTGGCGGNDLWVSHRKDKRDDTGWETPKNLGCVINTTGSETGPSIFEDEATGQTLLYYSSNRSGGVGGHDIYVSPMIGEDRETFGTPSPVAELNTANDDYHPFVRRKDGLEIIFFSNRAGGYGSWDLWSSNRPDTLSSWSTPVNLGPLVNSGADEARPSISWDGTNLYFWTSREGTLDVYIATRTKLPDSCACQVLQILWIGCSCLW